MIVKCGRTEFDLNRSDDIMYNGACYQIVTRKNGIGFDSYPPKIAKAKAEKMIKDGDLVFDRLQKSDYSNSELAYYKIKESE